MPYQNMLQRDYLRERPKDPIDAVPNLPFLNQKPDAYTVGNNDGRAHPYLSDPTP